MIQTKRTLFVFAAGMALLAGKSWADDKAAAATTPAAAPAAAGNPATKPAKGDSPTMAAMKAAIALEDAGNTTGAIDAFEKIGPLKSKSMEAWRLNDEAHVYLTAGAPDKALPLLEKATETNDKNYVAWNNLGTAYEATGDLEKAKDAYQKAIDGAKAAGADSSKAEGNLSALQPRLDKLEAKEAKDKPADDKAAPAGDQKK